MFAKIGKSASHVSTMLRMEMETERERVNARVAETTCLILSSTRDGMCNPPIKRRESSLSAIKPPYISTLPKAVLRPKGYRREHEYWKLAKDYWATQHDTKKAVRLCMQFAHTMFPTVEDVMVRLYKFNVEGDDAVFCARIILTTF